MIGELRRRYERRVQHFGGAGEETAAQENFAREFAAVHSDVLERQTRALIALNDRGSIDNQAMRRRQNDFDLERVRLADLPEPEMDDEEN